MNKKLIVSLFAIFFIAIGTFASISIAESGRGESGDDTETRVVAVQGTNSVKVAGSDDELEDTKYIYDSNVNAVDKYKAHCASIGGTFNTCGSSNFGEGFGPAVCVYTCENISLDDEKFEDKKKVEIEYEYEGSEYKYKIKYEGEEGYEVDTNLKVNKTEDGIKVETERGNKIIKVLPSQAVVYAFGSSIPGVNISLEEKNYSNIPAVVYKIDGDHEGKFLGLFKIKARYEAAVDANTGEVLEFNGPWWAFLITGTQASNETNNSIDNSVVVNDFKSCVDAGYKASDSNPRECKYKGNVFVEFN